MAPLIIKIGGALITEKASAQPQLDHHTLSRLCDEFKLWYGEGKSCILIHGAGSFGHGIVKESGLHQGFTKDEQRVPLALDQTQMLALSVHVAQALIARGVPAFPINPYPLITCRDGVIERFDAEPIKRLLFQGMVPVLVGTPAYDSRKGIAIVSGDAQLAHLAAVFKSPRALLASDVDGVFSADPSSPGARLIESLDRPALLRLVGSVGGSRAPDVTGGMAGKLTALLTLSGCSVQILNGRVPGNLRRALLGEPVRATTISL